MPPPMGRPGDYKQSQIPKPKNILGVPKYLFTLLGGFFSRFGYILKIVWDTGPWILFFMMFIAVFQGVTPVFGSMITKEILNELQILIENGPLKTDFFHSEVFFLIIFLFVYRFLKELVGTVNTAAHRIAGEKVVKQAKLIITIEKWMADQECVASAIQCWDSVEANYGCAACLSMSMMSQKGMPAACETDVMGAVSMLPEGHFCGMRRDVVDNLKKIGINRLSNMKYVLYWMNIGGMIKQKLMNVKKNY